MSNSWKQAEAVATEIAACLEPSKGDSDPHGAYDILKRWYRHASTHVTNPSWTDMEKVRGYFLTLYQM